MSAISTSTIVESFDERNMSNTVSRAGGSGPTTKIDKSILNRAAQGGNGGKASEEQRGSKDKCLIY